MILEERFFVTDVTLGQPGASPILGQKVPKMSPPPQPVSRDTFQVFASEDSDILIPNRNKDNLPTSTAMKRDRDDDSETNYSWEGTPEPPKHELKGPLLGYSWAGSEDQSVDGRECL